jgi:hypothetical protein
MQCTTRSATSLKQHSRQHAAYEPLTITPQAEQLAVLLSIATAQGLYTPADERRFTIDGCCELG